MASVDEDERLVNFLEHEVFCELSDQETLDTVEEEDECKEVERGGKRLHVEEGELSHQEEEEQNEAKKIKIGEGEISDKRLSSPSYLSSIELETEVEAALSPPKENDIITHNNVTNGRVRTKSGDLSRTILNEKFSQTPPELLLHILKFLSSEDLFSCSQSCRFLNLAAADESLWRRLYCMRWGMLPPRRLRECAWKRLYIQRDEEDMAKFVWNCPSEFKEYYIQMQAAKRSQAPHPSQVKDDRVILDKTLADQISMWKSSRGLADTVNHACSGVSCTYHQIGDAFICEKTGNVHVCDDTCKALVVNLRNDNFVCSISGRCFDRLVSPVEMERDAEQQQQKKQSHIWNLDVSIGLI